MSVRITGLDKLTLGQSGYVGLLTVRIPAGVSTKGVNFPVQIDGAPTHEAAISRALLAADSALASFLAQVRAERARRGM